MADPALTSLVTDMTAELLDAVSAAVTETWQAAADLIDDTAAQAVNNVVPVVAGAQRSVAALQASYVARVTELPLGAPEVATLDPEARWNYSPIIQARTLVGQGMAFEAAIGQAALRAAQVHSGDVLRARSDASSALSAGVESLRPIRWAKVPGAGACAWCVLVSGQLYYRPDGLPVHLNDRCGLEAITPAEAGRFTNAGTAFTNYRWTSKVSTQALADTQKAIAKEASRLAAQAQAQMTRRAA